MLVVVLGLLVLAPIICSDFITQGGEGGGACGTVCGRRGLFSFAIVLCIGATIIYCSILASTLCTVVADRRNRTAQCIVQHVAHVPRSVFLVMCIGNNILPHTVFIDYYLT